MNVWLHRFHDYAPYRVAPPLPAPHVIAVTMPAVLARQQVGLWWDSLVATVRLGARIIVADCRDVAWIDLDGYRALADATSYLAIFDGSFRVALTAAQRQELAEYGLAAFVDVLPPEVEA